MADDISREQLELNRQMMETLRQMVDVQAKGKEGMDPSEMLKTNLMKTGVSAATATKMLGNFAQATELAAKGLYGLAKTAEKSFQAAYSGSQKISAYNDALTELTDSTNSLIKAVGFVAAGLSLLLPGGPIIAGIIGFGTFMLTKTREIDNRLSNASREMADALYENYTKMTESGAAAANGIMGIRDQAKQFGLGVQQMGAMVEAINSSSQQFALLGGDVGKASKYFGDMGQEVNKNQEMLNRMGIPLEAVPGRMAGFMKSLAASGQSLDQNSKIQAQAFMDYTMQLDKLTQVTGKKAAELEDQYQKQLLQQQFGAKIGQLLAEGKKEEADR
nr:hypothetical protein [Oxalobacteraceae bacterium]